MVRDLSLYAINAHVLDILLSDLDVRLGNTSIFATSIHSSLRTCILHIQCQTILRPFLALGASDSFQRAPVIGPI